MKKFKLPLEIKIPLRVRLKNRPGKYQFFSLNLNQYRNIHFQLLSNAKRIFTDMMIRMFKAEIKLPTTPLERVKITYKVYAANKKRFDLMNFVSVLDKFFLDALISSGVIVDDSYKNVTYGEIKFAGLDLSADYHYVIVVISQQ